MKNTKQTPRAAGAIAAVTKALNAIAQGHVFRFCDHRATDWIEENLSPEFQATLFLLAHLHQTDRHCLSKTQAFRLSVTPNGLQKIVHTVKWPRYRRTYYFCLDWPITDTVLIVRQGKLQCMKFAQEL
ncbi:MAG: DUF960 family protein [Oscillospiraceae bacterium]|nr:DUF960 family protein [Oscillospiraceae bacterium]